MSKLLDDSHTESAQATRTRLDAPTACRLTLRGRVQGLGVRPAVARLARELAVGGSVSNANDGVSIHVEGPASRIRAFRERLIGCLPAGAVVESLDARVCPPVGESQFRIAPSTPQGEATTRVPVDQAACQECLQDVAATTNRRHGYALTTCTRCGPRYTIVDRMPYDRAATGMAGFTMCVRCRAEYADPSDRRFHSQTNSCAQCGPRIWSSSPGQRRHSDREAIARAVSALRAGQIVALRGLGGYQLLVDATCDAAVGELRRRKRRPAKPLAVLVADWPAADRLAVIDDAERRLLESPANPIVIVARRAGTPLAPAVCAPLRSVGLMLPTSPLHDALVRAAGRPLVITSGNLEGDPLSVDPDESLRQLSGVADVWLHHDRPILRPIDDSVVQVMAGCAATVRLARGLAPLSLDVDPCHKIIALGAHQKAAIALANGAQAVLGPHVGDLESEASRRRYLEHLRGMQSLYACEGALWVHDEHPDYFTTRLAAQQPRASMAVQHHHAHVVAGMVEHGWLEREVLGVAWDGTGYGPDGTIWGGEFLLATACGFRRVAHLRPLAIVGGERAVREPWRVAIALACQALGPEQAAALRFEGVADSEVAAVVRLAQKPHLCPQTSSAGRLFDGIAALVLNTAQAQYEGQPAVLLENACDPTAARAYELPIAPGAPALLDWRPLVRQVLLDRLRGEPPSAIAMRFHRALAGGIARVAADFAGLPVVLSGGCFVNKTLTELTAAQLAAVGREVGTPGAIPVGDGGVAAGQLAVAAARWQAGWRPCA